jgi:hypothetical protein
MAYDSRSLDDYVDVAERIAEFRGKYPDGSLRGDWRIERIGEQALVAYRAEAWRTPDDSAPGVGCAWELVPGRTPFTKGSELQNAETSAWGRAIIAVGAAEPTPDDRPTDRGPVDNSGDLWTDQPAGEFDIGQPEGRPGSIDGKQLKAMHGAFGKLGITDRGVRLGMTADIIGRQVLTANQLSRLEAAHLLKVLKERTGESNAGR